VSSGGTSSMPSPRSGRRPALDGVDAAVELAVLRDVRERVHVRADVGAEDDDVVRGRTAVLADLVAVPARQRVPVRRVVRRLRHPDLVRARQVVGPHARHGLAEQRVGHGRLLSVEQVPRGLWRRRPRRRTAVEADGAAGPRASAAATRDDALGACELVVGRGEDLVDVGASWRGWMTDLPWKPSGRAPGVPRAGPSVSLEVGVDAVDRRPETGRAGAQDQLGADVERREVVVADAPRSASRSAVPSANRATRGDRGELGDGDRTGADSIVGYSHDGPAGMPRSRLQIVESAATSSTRPRPRPSAAGHRVEAGLDDGVEVVEVVAVAGPVDADVDVARDDSARRPSSSRQSATCRAPPTSRRGRRRPRGRG
jgi:hypothetical protein